MRDTVKLNHETLRVLTQEKQKENLGYSQDIADLNCQISLKLQQTKLYCSYVAKIINRFKKNPFLQLDCSLAGKQLKSVTPAFCQRNQLIACHDTNFHRRAGRHFAYNVQKKKSADIQRGEKVQKTRDLAAERERIAAFNRNDERLYKTLAAALVRADQQFVLAGLPSSSLLHLSDVLRASFWRCCGELDCKNTVAPSWGREGGGGGGL